MAAITFSGLSSGIDSASIIDKLVEIERRPAVMLEGRKSDATRHKSIITDIGSELKALKDVLSGMMSGDDIQRFEAATSDEDTIGVTSSGSAFPGTYSINVDRLAQGQTSVSTETVGFAGPGVAGAIDITVGSEALVNVAYGATDSLYDIAGLINDSDANVNASVVFDGGTGYQLMVSSTDTGVDSAITFAETGGVLGLDLLANRTVTAQNSRIYMNGIEIERPTNVMSDVLSGLTLDLQKVTGTDPNTVVSVERDVAGVQEGVQEFVDGYNKVVDFINKQLSYDGVTKGTDTLFGDSTLMGLQRSLGAMITSTYAHDGGTTALGILGIELDNTGHLAIDATKFESAVMDDPTAVESLFAGDGAAGLSQALTDLVDTYTRSGDGIFEAKKDGIDDRIDGFEGQIENIENRAANVGDRMRRQFAALEEAMVALQQQQGYLSSLFGG